MWYLPPASGCWVCTRVQGFRAGRKSGTKPEYQSSNKLYKIQHQTSYRVNWQTLMQNRFLPCHATKVNVVGVLFWLFSSCHEEEHFVLRCKILSLKNAVLTKLCECFLDYKESLVKMNLIFLCPFLKAPCL